MGGRRFVIAISVMSAFTIAAASCGGDDDSDDTAASVETTAGTEATATTTVAEPERTAVTFVATDFAFDGPAEVPAGIVDVTIVNQGQEDHHVQLIRLDGDVDVDALTTATDSGDFSVLSEVTFLGGPNGAGPGAERTATVDLDPGSYVVICMIPSVDGVAHYDKGMVAPLEVVPAEGAPAPAPEPVTTIHMGKTGEFVFTVPPDLPAKGTVAVVNDGEQAHELVYYPIVDGSTFEDVKAYVLVPPGSPTPEGPPPSTSRVAAASRVSPPGRPHGSTSTSPPAGTPGSASSPTPSRTACLTPSRGWPPR
ncbi:MAG: hypothetical protein M5T61_06140 [Acidimicrobiia bacterium]|nr:hypothetical protein [Acidimicrobiia bacterium]